MSTLLYSKYANVTHNVTSTALAHFYS